MAKIFILLTTIMLASAILCESVQENTIFDSTHIKSTAKPKEGPNKVNSLDDLCRIFHIHPTNCSCDQFFNDPRNAGMLFWFYFQFKKID